MENCHAAGCLFRHYLYLVEEGPLLVVGCRGGGEGDLARLVHAADGHGIALVGQHVLPFVVAGSAMWMVEAVVPL